MTGRIQSRGFALWFAGLLAAAELLISRADYGAGLAAHGGILFWLLLRASRRRPATAGGEAAVESVCDSDRLLAQALLLLPLIRIISLVMPLSRLPLLTWYPIVGSAVLAACWGVVRVSRLQPAEIALTTRRPLLQLCLALIGFGLGYVEFQILRPQPLIAAVEPVSLALAAGNLLLFTGFTEELVFRGIIQTSVERALNRNWAIFYTSLLFALLHLGYQSIPDLLFVFAVGCLFGKIVQKTGSLLGVTLAHGLTNISLYLLWPFPPESWAGVLSKWLEGIIMQ